MTDKQVAISDKQAARTKLQASADVHLWPAEAIFADIPVLPVCPMSAECLQVLEHLVHAMAARALASMADKQAAASELLAELQASADVHLWPAEVTSADAPVSVTYPAVQRLVRQGCGGHDLRGQLVFRLGAPLTSQSFSFWQVVCTFLTCVLAVAQAY